MAGGGTYQMLFQLSASLGGGFSSAFSSGSKAVTEMQNKINALNKTNNDISAYQKQQDAIAKTEAKLQRLQGQYDRLAAVEAKTGTEEAELKNKMEDKQDSIEKTNDKLEAQKAKLESMGEALQKAGIDTDNLSSESDRLAQEAREAAEAQEQEAKAAQEAGEKMGEAAEGVKSALEALGAMKALEAFYNTLKECSDVAAKFETSMAGVKRTVGGDDNFIKALGESFKEMSTTMPITASELADIATTAGQLGIAQENVESFTTVMAQLATTTDLSADTAATMLAQFANITGITDYERLGSTVASLGDSTATTASKVVEMSQGMAAAANVAGMSATDVLAISAAVGSLGIEAASGSTSMSTLISTLYKATETGNKLEEFASVAGMTAGEFKEAWATDAAGALNSFIQGLNDVERNGKSATVILDELGITNVRQTKAILGLASAGDLLSNTLAQAESAWSENTALGEKAAVMYGTTEAKMTMLGNAATNVQIAIGDALNPALGGLADMLTGVVQPMAEWIEKNPAVVRAITAFVGVLGAAVAAVTGYVAVTKLAAAASALFASSFPPIATITLLAAGIGGLVYALTNVSDASNAASIDLNAVAEEYQQLEKDLEDQQNIIDLVNQYESLQGQLESLGELDASDIELKAKIENDGVTEDNIKLIKSLKEEIDNKKGEIKQVLEISGAEQVTDENLQKIIDLANDSEDGDYALMQELSLIGVDEITPENLKKLKDLANNIKDDEATLKQNLEITGFEDYDKFEKVSNLELSSETYNILMSLNITNYDDAKAKLSQLGVDVLSAKHSLDDAKAELDAMEAQANNLTAIAEAKKTSKKDRKAAEEELTTLNEQIEAQKNKVSDLTTNYEGLKDQFLEVRTAAAQLKAQEDALKTAQEQLGLSADENKGSMEEQARLLKEQAEAQEAIVRAKQAELRLTAGQGLGAQAQEYAKNAQAYEDAQDRIQKASDRSKAITDTDALKDHLQGIIDTIGQLESEVDDNGFLKYDWDSGKIKEYRDEFASLMKAATGRDVDTSSIFLMGNALNTLGNAAETADKTIVGLGEQVESATADAAAAQEKMQSFVDSTVALIESGAMDAEAAEAAMRLAFEQSGQDAAILDTIMDQVNQTLEEHAEAAKKAAEAEEELNNQQGQTSEGSKESKRTFEDMVKEIETLKEAYNTAYEAAKASMEGQFKLFERANTVTANAGNVNGTGKKGKDKDNNYVQGLKDQAAYISQYTDNYTKASEKLKAVEQEIYGDENTGEYSNSLLSQLADGSAESAQIIADIAAATPEDAKALIESYATVQSETEKFASSVADVQTDFTKKMDKLKKEIEDAVQEMDFSGDAQANAEASMNAFVQAISGFSGKAKQAAEKVVDSVEQVCNTANPTITIDVKLGNMPNIPHDAEGTNNAERGVTLVGEEGPELVYMNGGEAVLDATKTAALLRNVENMNAQPVNASISNSKGGDSYTITVSPQYNVSSGVNAAEVKAAIEQQNENLRDEVESVINDLIVDQNRRRYA